MPQAFGFVTDLQIICIDAEVPHVNPADHDLAIIMINQRTDFFFDLDRPATAQSRAHRRDDAVRTLQYAAVLNLHEGSLVSFEFTDPIGHVNDAKAAKHVGQFSLIGDDFDHVRQF